MSETKHTAAPWVVGKGAGYFITRENAPGAFAVGINPDCTLVDSPDDIEEESRANAYLMAAAPDLLAALKDAERILSYFADGETSFSGPGTPKTVRDGAHAAIAKAEGRDNG